MSTLSPQPATNCLDGLNEAQLRAATHDQGPMLIIAGAGTGKTAVITRRIAWLIETGRAKPEEILALTFTDKAAGEMHERVDALLPVGYLELRISTFHSFCERLLKDHGLAIGLPNEFRLANETDAYLMVRRAFDRFELEYYKPRSNPTKFIRALLKHFSRVKDEAVTPGEYRDAADAMLAAAAASGSEEELEEAKRYAELAAAYRVYQDVLLENDALDFGDLQLYALELLKSRPAILASLRRQFKYVLVDEFQDTNWAQYALVKLLVPDGGNLAVVGDDDQSIYKFRGASVSNILQFKNDYPSAAEVVLTTNYRSLQGVLDLAYSFIKQNDPNRLEAKLMGPDGSALSKRLAAHREGTALIEPLHFDNLEGEADGVVRRIVELRSADPELTWNDFCILVRSNGSAIDYSIALDRADIPFQFAALQGLYAKPIVMEVTAYFKLLDEYRDSSAMWLTLNSRPYRIANADLLAITHEARRKAESVYEVCCRHETLPNLSDETRATIVRLLADIDKHTEIARTKSAEEVYVNYLFDSSYLKILTAEETLANREDLSYLVQFRKRIRRFEQQGDDRSLRHFIEEFELEREAGAEGGLAFDPETGPDMVHIMTVHAAKGLEFKHVFIVGLVDKRFPSVERSEPIELPANLIKEVVPEGDAHLEEERRLFYVAATRAKDGLYLTWADDYGGKTLKKPSRFLAELGFVAPTEKGSGKRARKEEAIEGPSAPTAGAPVPPDVAPAYYSFSQLEAYSRCPAQYKFAHILRIPTFGNFKSSFGRTVHAALERFFNEIADRRAASCQLPAASSTASPLPVSEEELLSYYDEAWIDDWYPDRPTKEEWREIGRQALRRIWRDTAERQPKVLMLEQDFTLKIGERTLRGTIDRIDELPDGRVAIIDYKTSEPKKEEDLKADNKRQLHIYQLAVKQCLQREVAELTFSYVLDGSTISFLGTDKDLAKVEEKVESACAAIESGDFTASPGPQCRFCDFRNICSARE